MPDYSRRLPWRQHAAQLFAAIRTFRSDLNNLEVARLLSGFLEKKGLD
jgi:hypothetical protein